MSTRLVEDAVYNTRPVTPKGVLDRLFAFWFKRFVYNQIWEDPRVDLAALRLTPSSRLVTIASGGCNVLNYLLADPASIVAVDLNPAHIALTRLKSSISLARPPIRPIARPISVPCARISTATRAPSGRNAR